MSSAYRLGNTYSFLIYAINHCVFFGVGFGGSHFLYPILDFPSFMTFSAEFHDMINGDATWRVPIFNIWVRLFVEIGIVPTIILLFFIIRRILQKEVSGVVKIFFFSTFTMTLSTDSYIYGLWAIALFLGFSVSKINVLQKL
ncbi:hypothetical protein [Robbsia andropogonis]|uniref:hypothetical protein n=1 Tax=Robbsia andropogonis TaxID=28092 RepID=UPI00209CBE22|nr:hypothetical protein [Robbsia andropogonis]MCP1121492.1 hypothetical protein [Robbsia andropogonis]MCP1131318.1 hypothetical protein [Robbsia andropogonis]